MLLNVPDQCLVQNYDIYTYNVAFSQALSSPNLPYCVFTYFGPPILACHCRKWYWTSKITIWSKSWPNTDQQNPCRNQLLQNCQSSRKLSLVNNFSWMTNMQRFIFSKRKSTAEKWASVTFGTKMSRKKSTDHSQRVL